MCGVLIFKNGHEVSSRVGDMSRTFNHLFVVINMPTQISHTCLRAGENFLVKEEQGIPFPPRRYTVDVDTSFQQCETRQRYHTRKQVRGERNSTKVYRNVGHMQYACFKSILFFLII